MPTACEERLDRERFQPTAHAQGAWNHHEQHMARAGSAWTRW